MQLQAWRIDMLFFKEGQCNVLVKEQIKSSFDDKGLRLSQK